MHAQDQSAHSPLTLVKVVAGGDAPVSQHHQSHYLGWFLEAPISYHCEEEEEGAPVVGEEVLVLTAEEAGERGGRRVHHGDVMEVRVEVLVDERPVVVGGTKGGIETD